MAMAGCISEHMLTSWGLPIDVLKNCWMRGKLGRTTFFWENLGAVQFVPLPADYKALCSNPSGSGIQL